MQVPTTPAIHPVALRSRGIGTLVAAGFGVLWANAAMTAEPALRVWPVQLAIIGVTVALLAAGVATIARGMRSARASNVSTEPRRRIWARYLLVVILEIAALNVIGWLLGNHGLTHYLMPAIAIVVGLHFFPLARVFRTRYLHITAAVMTLAGIGAVLAMVWGIQPSLANAVADVICALALWFSAGNIWFRSLASRGHACHDAIMSGAGVGSPR